TDVSQQQLHRREEKYVGDVDAEQRNLDEPGVAASDADEQRNGRTQGPDRKDDAGGLAHGKLNSADQAGGAAQQQSRGQVDVHEEHDFQVDAAGQETPDGQGEAGHGHQVGDGRLAQEFAQEDLPGAQGGDALKIQGAI